MNKFSYPVSPEGTQPLKPRNRKKWMEAMEKIIQGAPYLGWKTAFDQITRDWDIMETLDFKSWSDFYKSQEHLKYKTAQYIPNVLPVGLKASIPGLETYPVKQEVDAETRALQEKQWVQDKLKSLIGRLNSAERIAALPEVQIALHKVLENGVTAWLATLQSLKREIQLVPLRYTSASLMDSLVIRGANRLKAYGHFQGAQLLLKVADMAATQSPTNPMSVLPSNPIDVNMGGQPVGVNSGMPFNEPGPLGAPPIGNMPDPNPEKDQAVIEFLKLLENPYDEDAADDKEDVEIEEPVKKMAQEVPPPTLTPETPQPLLQEAPPPDTSISHEDLLSGDPFDSALANVKITDIIGRLEGVANLFKHREIARQLAIVDLMMDKMGIASFFPSLAESMKSALESNSYCQTRVEDILAKLRGLVSNPVSDSLEGGMEETVRKGLEQAEEKERVKKQQKMNEPEEVQPLSPVNPAVPELNQTPQPKIEAPKPNPIPRAPATLPQPLPG